MSGGWYRFVSRWSHRWEWHHARVMGPLEPGGGYVRRCDWCGWSEAFGSPQEPGTPEGKAER